MLCIIAPILFTCFLLTPPAKAQDYDPATISKVSKGLTDNQLFNNTLPSSPNIERKERNISPIYGAGLSAFDDDFNWVQKENIYAIGQTIFGTYKSLCVDIAGNFLGRYGPLAGPTYTLWTSGRTMWSISDAKTPEAFYLATRGTPAWHLGVAVKILDKWDLAGELKNAGAQYNSAQQPAAWWKNTPTNIPVEYKQLLIGNNINIADWSRIASPIKAADWNQIVKPFSVYYNITSFHVLTTSIPVIQVGTPPTVGTATVPTTNIPQINTPSMPLPQARQK
jgi:hypothetical protein